MKKIVINNLDIEILPHGAGEPVIHTVGVGILIGIIVGHPLQL